VKALPRQPLFSENVNTPSAPWFFRLVGGLVLAGLVSAVAVPGTLAAAPAVSSNWAGYVVTLPGASAPVATTTTPATTTAATSGTTTTATPAPAASSTFGNVAGTWVEPKANCTAAKSSGIPTASAFWIGLGGNSNGSNSLEQTGTEADCGSNGQAHYFAWYELVPAAAVSLQFNVTPGDTISASVVVKGDKVTIDLRNLSQGTSYLKTLPMSDPDTTSAEWVAEAPSICFSQYRCREQSLTNFGTVTFKHASVQSGTLTGSITNSAWSASAIELQSGAAGGGFGRFQPEGSVSEALPDAPSHGGASFSITWHQLTMPAPPGFSSGGGGFGAPPGGNPGGFGDGAI
jgi:hypothetical protein